ncbi:hypothetical protein MNBD_ALPHA08-1931 [hydrothermal vent metagenome]|uniref:Uncharacterized protein n=1 Tax=hydrothermal vent metagenome TaxID=652676 RepID=A0A3B0RG98_9ZZZZ
MRNFVYTTRMVLALLLVLALPVDVAHAQARKSLVGVDKVRAEPLSQTVPVIATLIARQSGAVAVEIGGTVRQLKVAVGDQIKKGQVIAVLEADTRTARAKVLEAELAGLQALLDVAQIDLTLAKQEMDRQGRLKKSNAFNRSVYETRLQNFARAQAQISRAKAAIAAKQADIDVLELEISKSTITSPYAGVVVRRRTEQGSYVRSGDAVVELIGDKQLEIEANVPALRIVGLNPGSKVNAELADGTRFIATVRAILPVENPRTRTRPVRFSPVWPQDTARLASGQSVTLLLPTGKARQVVTVHKDAIVNKAGRNVVFVIRDGKAESRNVTLGVATGGRIEVIAGLKAGEVTVVRGNERLRQGSAVKVATGS